MVSKTKQLDLSRQEFVSNVSHELKTPITSIKVLADSLTMQENVPVELYKEFLTDIAEEIDRENKIINDLLSLVKMDRTAAELNISQVNINELLELILKRLRPIAAKRNIELVFESFRPVIAEIDEVKLTLAFSNLVENAIKYNIESGVYPARSKHLISPQKISIAVTAVQTLGSFIGYRLQTEFNNKVSPH